MGSARLPVPVKVFASLLLSEGRILSSVERRLVERLGPVDHRTDCLPFEHTDYYATEMGSGLQRVLLSFERLAQPDLLAALKRDTNAMEDNARSRTGAAGRTFNIDPGYIEQSKVVLASTKNFYHRIYLGDGIFGEVTMHFSNNAYQSFPWTYPDYKSEEYQRFFLRMRQIYRTQLKQMCLTRKRG